MKTINVGRQDIKVVRDDNGNAIGFAGTVKIYDIYVYVDTQTGEGYDKVIAKMGRYVGKLMLKYNLSNLGFDLEDTRQHIVMLILEGIPKYNPEKNTTLSTFLHMRVERRMINEVRNVGASIRNPTTLKTSLLSIVCECGRKFTTTTSCGESLSEKFCFSCKSSLDRSRALTINIPPSSIQNSGPINIESSRMTIDDFVSEDSYDIPLVFGKKTSLEDKVSFAADITRCLEKESSIVKKLVELVCVKEYSIRAAALELGMSHTGADNKLKRLGRRKAIRDAFGR